MIDHEYSDSKLVSLYQQGNEKSFEMLLNRYKSRLYTAIFFIVKDQYEAEDLLQEVFVKAIDIIRDGRYNEEGKFYPWISRMAHNLAIDSYRSQRRKPTVTLEDGSTLADVFQFELDFDQKAALKDRRVLLRELIRQLPEKQKEVLIMRQYLEMSFQDIAERTGVSINTALGRMRYALIHLRKKWEQIHAYDDKHYTKEPEDVPMRRGHQRRTS